MKVDCLNCEVYKKCIAATFGLSELKLFEKGIVKKKVKKGEYVFLENQTAREMFIVVKGSIKIIKDEDLPYPITLGIAHLGELVGIEAVTQEKYSASGTCVSDTTVCLFNKTHIDEIMAKHDETCQFLFSKLLNHIKKMYEYSLIFISGDATSKVAQTLLSFFGNEDTIEVTKEEIALMTGSRRETVSRILSEMKRRKIIDTNQKLITLINKDSLILLTKNTKRK
jgi:CRP-like cAMP-binding protein